MGIIKFSTVDEMGIDQMGVYQVGIYHYHNVYAQTYIINELSLSIFS
jgi:hypothetical protein